MRIGKHVKFTPEHATGKAQGVVTWIHPRGRFCIVEYTHTDGRQLRECFGLTRDGLFFAEDRVRMLRDGM
ncbi:hypothetical protein [Intestinibacillus massiliensis]